MGHRLDTHVLGRPFGVRVDADIAHENPPQRAQQQQLQDDSDGEVANEATIVGLHGLLGIKTRATQVIRGKAFKNNGLERPAWPGLPTG
ncbi:MAG: hypothetical protein KGL43_16690 [Burkholderiales bacterium]|nr:hypothetical protein [Burkholderiales bacterium]